MRARRIAIGIGAIVGALLLAAVVVPRFAMVRLLEPRLSAALGAPVHVGGLSWNPFRATWTLHDVRVDAAHGPPAVRLRRLAARLWLRDLLRRRWVVRDLQLAGARVRLRSVDEGWELPVAPGPATGSVAGEESVLPVVTLEGGRAAPVTLRFEPREGPASSLRLREIALAGALVAPGTIDARGSLRGRLEHGKIALAASFRRREGAERVRARLAATRLDLGKMLHLAPRSLSAPAVAGLLDLRATYDQLSHRGHSHRRAFGRGVVRELAVGPRGAPGLHSSTLAVDRFDVDLQRHTVALGHARLREPEVRLARVGNGLVIPGVLEGAPAATPGWGMSWQGIELTGGAAHYADASDPDRRVALEITRADLGAGERPDSSLPVSFAGRLAGGGDVTLTGTLVRDPFVLRADVSFENVVLPPLAAFADAPLPLESGRASGRLSVEAAEVVSGSGTVTLDDVKTAGPSGGRPEDVLAFKSLRAEIRRFHTAPLQVQLQTLRIEWPYALVDRGPEGIFPLTVVQESPPGGGTASLPVVRIGSLGVHGGRIDFRDLTLEPPYWRSLANLEVDATGVDLQPARVAKLRATGLVDELSPLRVEGTIGARTELRADVERVALPPFNAYLKAVSGYLVSSGAVTAHSEITIERSQLEVTNRVVLSRLGLGGPSEEDFLQRQVGIPLTLAVALMKDYRGNIELDLPFAGDLSSTHFSLGDVTLQAVVRAIRGAVMSPLTALGRVFLSGGRIEHFTLDPVPFPPGGRELDGAGHDRVLQVARVLGVHPQLGITVRGDVAGVDLERIQEAKALTTLSSGRADDRLRNFLKARLGGLPEPALDLADRERLATLIASLPWPAEDLRQLATDRAAAVATALLSESGFDTKRLKLAPAELPTPGPLAPLPSASLDLSEG